MKRDMDLAREILLRVESSTSENSIDLSIQNYSRDEIIYHIYLLKQAGLLEAIIVDTYDGRNALPQTLTWDGHEFLDALRNENVWNKTKEIVKEKGGGLAFGVIKDLAIQIARQMVGLP